MNINTSIRNLIIIFLLIMIFQVSGIYLSIFFKPDLNFYFLPFMQILIILFPVWLLSGINWEERRDYLGFSKPEFDFKILIMLLLIAVVFQLAYNSYSSLMDKLLEGTYFSNFINVRDIRVKAIENFMEDANALQLIFFTFSIAIVPAFVEETAFRGFLQNSYYSEGKKTAALIVPSSLFALVHLNPLDFIPIFFMAIILGRISIVRRSLNYSIILHFFINFSVIVNNLMFGNSTKLDYIMENQVFAIISLIISIILVYVIIIKLINIIEKKVNRD